MSSDDKTTPSSSKTGSKKELKSEALKAEKEGGAKEEDVSNAPKQKVTSSEPPKPVRNVSFPDEDRIVTQYFEPANPWRNVAPTTRADLVLAYYNSCRRHGTLPIESIMQQIREMPEKAIGGSIRAARLTLNWCSLLGSGPADALEAVLQKAQFRRIELVQVEIDDEGAEALFDMIEYYESANAVSISGPRRFGIRGWQAVCRMIKKSAALTELEISNHPLEASHAPVLSRALHTVSCQLRTLCLQQANLAGEPLLCLVIALKSNYSVCELRLCDNQLTPVDAAMLGSLLRYNYRIQLLDLSNNYIADTGMSHLAEALCEQFSGGLLQSPRSSPSTPLSPNSSQPPTNNECRGLSVLVLWNNQLTRNSSNHLSKAVKSLTVLNIGRNALGCESVRAIAAASGTLVCLGLQAARLGVDAAKAIAEYIRADTKLERLDLRENNLGLEGLQLIAAAMQVNSNITQIDLDDPSVQNRKDSTINETETSEMHNLVLEIRKLCRKNEPSTEPRAPRRKMSLTGHTAPSILNAQLENAQLQPPGAVAGPSGAGVSGAGAGAGAGAGGARLRSPAPSPAGSPLPTQHNRFSVTRVTPERESSSESSPSTPTRPVYAASTASRFRVVQVAEPPQIHVQQPSSEPRKSPSRFSVTRNYDSLYNTVPSPSPPPAVTADTSHPETKTPVTYRKKTTVEKTEERTKFKVSKVDKVSDGTSHIEIVESKVLERDRVKTEVKNVEGDERDGRSNVDVIKLSGTKIEMLHPNVRSRSEDIHSEIKDERLETESIKKAASDSKNDKVSQTIKNVPVIAETEINEDMSKSSHSKSDDTTDTDKSISLDRTDDDFDSVFYEPDIIKNDTSESKDDKSGRVVPIAFVFKHDTKTEPPRFDSKERSKFDISKFGSPLPEMHEKSYGDVKMPVVIQANKIEPRKIETGFSEPSNSHDDRDERVSRQSDMSGESDKTDQIVSSDVNEAKNLISDVVISKKTRDNLTVKVKLVPGDANVNVDVDNVNKCDKVHKNVSDNIELSDNLSYQDKAEQVTHSEVIDDNKLKTETKLVRNKTEVSETEKVDMQVEVSVKTESVKPAKVQNDQNIHDVAKNNDVNSNINKDDVAMKKIEAITEDLGNLIQEMKDLSHKTAVLAKKDVEVRNDCTQTEIVDVNKVDNLGNINDVPANVIRDNVVLKKNKSESSLDSPDLEVSRLMNKKVTCSPFCDSSSSLEISGSSMESLNLEIQSHTRTQPVIIQESVESDSELDRRKIEHVTLSTESSLESSELPVNSNLLNMSVSSNDSVSPIMFGKGKKLHGSLSSLEASVSSLESAKHEKLMVTSADSGIEYSIQNPTENKEEMPFNEGTLTNNSGLKETCKNPQDTLTSSPKRTSSLLDVPAMKSKGLERMRKISWVAPSSSFQVQKPEPEKVEMKLPSHLEKLLSLFQHPTSLFSRTQSEDERKSASNTPPRKDSSLTSSFWSWGNSGKEKEEKEEERDDRDSPEATDSTLSERVQVSFVDESFSRKLNSKTPSTDTENTLSEFQSFPQGNSDGSEQSQADKDRVGQITTEDSIVQNVDLSKNVEDATKVACTTDLINPNDLNKNYETSDRGKIAEVTEFRKGDEKIEDVKTSEPVIVRPRTFAAVLKSSGSENSLGKPSPDSGQPVDKLPSKVIRGIKENISPENTLTSSMSNTLALELSERREKLQSTKVQYENKESKAPIATTFEAKAPIATIEETCDETCVAETTVQLAYIDDIKFIDDKNVSGDSGVTSLECVEEMKTKTALTELDNVDVGKDALSYLIQENQDFDPDIEQTVANVTQEHSLAQELKDAEVKQKLIDLSPELVLDEALELPEKLTSKELKGLRTSPVIPERAKLKKSNSLEHIVEKDSPKSKTIAFKIPESTNPRDIPERRSKLRSRSGSSPKSLPESLNKQFPISKMDSVITKRKKKISSLGKIARDSLLQLNMSEEEIEEFRRSYKLTSVESLKSLESVSEDALSQSGTSADSRCRSCLRTSQESLISLDSMPEECKCLTQSDKEKRSLR